MPEGSSGFKRVNAVCKGKGCKSHRTNRKRKSSVHKGIIHKNDMNTITKKEREFESKKITEKLDNKTPQKLGVFFERREPDLNR